jgi:hypothetical protein
MEDQTTSSDEVKPRQNIDKNRDCRKEAQILTPAKKSKPLSASRAPPTKAPEEASHRNFKTQDY